MENRSVAKDEQLKWKEIGGRGWEMVVGGGKRRIFKMLRVFRPEKIFESNSSKTDSNPKDIFFSFLQVSGKRAKASPHPIDTLCNPVGTG
ncbi:hypothetical protein RRG08_028129 [Elysia crispata]|uniref:Uncharacterized protein n=1 Tax=Elysia crispata TaxID=231223 RepID=A0AAE1A4U9_9GAST|nr:hypothetical protein RRG08_028129 [Elysia crispata]